MTVEAEPRTWVVHLPWDAPPLSLNRRLHHMVEHRMRKQIMTDVGWLLKHARVPPIEHAEVTLVWSKTRAGRADTDNPAPTLKACIDAIVKQGLLPDDDSTRVHSSTMILHKADPQYERGCRLVIAEVLHPW